MRTLLPTTLAVLALPFMAVSQTEPQQSTQEQTKETQSKAPNAKKKMPASQERSRSDAQSDMGNSKKGTGANTQTDTSTRTGDTGKRNESGASMSKSNSANMNGGNQTTTVNKQEFRSRHEEVFKLGRHPKDYFVQRYGASHFRLMGNTYFVFVDNCWVAVDVDGFTYTERVICPGDSDYVVVD